MATFCLALERQSCAVFPVVLSKILSLFLGKALSMPTSLGETLQILGLLFFSGQFTVMVMAFSLRSIHSSLHASPMRAPVSFSS